jgi:hypothetical protein
VLAQELAGLYAWAVEGAARALTRESFFLVPKARDQFMSSDQLLYSSVRAGALPGCG